MTKIPAAIKALVDEIFAIRAQAKALDSLDKKYSGQLKDYMEKHKLKDIEGRIATATKINKPRRQIAPEDFLDAVGDDLDKLLAVVTVRMNSTKDKTVLGADYYLSEEDLESLIKTTDVPTLLINAKKRETEVSPTRLFQTAGG